MAKSTKGTKFIFITAEGKEFTRTSPRPYTHVIVGRYDWKKSREQVLSDANRKHHASNYQYYAKLASAKVGDLRDNGRHATWLVTQADIDSSIEALGGAKTEQEYVDAIIAGMLAKRAGYGDVGEEEVLSWSMSLGNATRAIGQFVRQGYLSVRVAEITQREQ
jgi:hypothetical protein